MNRKRCIKSLVLGIAFVLLAGCGASSYDSKNSYPSGTNNQYYPVTLPTVKDENTQSNTEVYKEITESDFVSPISAPLSTFAADVDTASYSNIRRYITSGSLPPKDAVRIEEMINYFPYNYIPPKEDEERPFSVNVELSKAPWNEKHELLKIGLKGKVIDVSKLPKSNLVFLVDVSGSMGAENKLTLVKTSLNILVDNLRGNDLITIVTYSDEIKVRLEPTSGENKEKIKSIINSLVTEGSTNGQQGLQTAYAKAKINSSQYANSRVILCTDGDFNVGMTGTNELEDYISGKKTEGIFLSVFGFGYGNLKDDKLETLADKGNGNYAYIDGIAEAKKVFSKQLFGNMVIIAKDVKFQAEFNQDFIKGYRLIGYENRALKPEDFQNNDKDGGEIGMGHTVTAIYELIPKDSDEVVNIPKADLEKAVTTGSINLFSFSINYKKPSETTSLTIKTDYKKSELDAKIPSSDFNFSTSVVEFGLLLRESKYKYGASFKNLIERAQINKGEDSEGYRAEFIKIAERAKEIYSAAKQ